MGYYGLWLVVKICPIVVLCVLLYKRYYFPVAWKYKRPRMMHLKFSLQAMIMDAVTLWARLTSRPAMQALAELLDHMQPPAMEKTYKGVMVQKLHLAVHHCLVFQSSAVRRYTVPTHEPECRMSPYAIIYIHGGAWMVGSPDVYADTLAYLANLTSTPVFAITYSKSPKHRFPAALNDCMADIENIIQYHIHEYCVGKKLVLIGDSVGATMAAVISRKLSEKGVPVHAQALIYPLMQQTDLHLPSYISNRRAPIVRRRDMAESVCCQMLGKVDAEVVDALISNTHAPRDVIQRFRDQYSDVISKNIKPGEEIPQIPEAHNPRVWDKIKNYVQNEDLFPLMSSGKKLAEHLPPTFVYAAAQDPLRDDALLFAHQLKMHEGKVETHAPGAGYHGIVFSPHSEEGTAMFSRVHDFIWRHVVLQNDDEQ